MPPLLALCIWLVLLLGLLRFDPARDPKSSLALWVPLTWMFLVGSRLPSQWFGGVSGSAAIALTEGNPLDRTILSVLIALAIIILVFRRFKWGQAFVHNIPLVALISFALLSVLWSDFPFITFKHWFRDLGDYLVILVVLSDPRPIDALQTLLRRVFYLLIPLSIVLHKYYPAISKQYDPWSGVASFVGAGTSKNMLGVVCLVSGLFFFWDTVVRWPDRKVKHANQIILVNIAFFIMTVWLLSLANSATSRVCLVIGCLVILVAQSNWGMRHRTFVKILIPACFCLYLILAYGFDINGALAKEVGRDPTFTGRTNIWKAVLSINTNPIVGTGYESFWLGARLSRVWELAGGVNEAHNGYLEVYLNLGLIGVFLLFVFLVTSFWAICKRLSPSFKLASLGLAAWAVVLFYNMTESAAFKGQFLWVMFVLLAVIISGQTPVARDVTPSYKKVVLEKRPSEMREGIAV